MKVIADKSFQKDILKLDAATKNQISKLVIQLIQTTSLNEIPNFKKIRGFKNAYRIRLGNYRIGIRVDGETVLLVRILHRKDIYKYFPFLI
jgi:mRNA interferase RelE/StbE